jgi:hypothetical protein
MKRLKDCYAPRFSVDVSDDGTTTAILYTIENGTIKILSVETHAPFPDASTPPARQQDQT